jgi:hypothetical protein
MNNQESAAFLLCLIPGLLCGFPTSLVLVTALLPTFFERARHILAARPWRSFLLGLVNFLFFFAIAAVFAEAGFALLKGVAFLSLFVVLPLMVVAGLATAAGIVGERVLALLTERSGTALATLVVGIVCLGLSALLPIVGWLVLIILLMTGFGAALLALLRRNGNAPVERDPEASTMPATPEATDE